MSTVSWGTCPVAAMKRTRWRPSDLPNGGQKNYPGTQVLVSMDHLPFLMIWRAEGSLGMLG